MKCVAKFWGRSHVATKCTCFKKPNEKEVIKYCVLPALYD